MDSYNDSGENVFQLSSFRDRRNGVGMQVERAMIPRGGVTSYQMPPIVESGENPEIVRYAIGKNNTILKFVMKNYDINNSTIEVEVFFWDGNLWVYSGQSAYRSEYWNNDRFYESVEQVVLGFFDLEDTITPHPLPHDDALPLHDAHDDGD